MDALPERAHTAVRADPKVCIRYQLLTSQHVLANKPIDAIDIDTFLEFELEGV